MFAIRAPFAVVAGTLISAALFLTLSQLVGARFEVLRAIDVGPFNFTPQRKITPIENKRDPKVERKPPPEIVIVDGPGGTNTGIDTTAVNVGPPRVVLDGAGSRGLPIGTDRDVLPLVRVNPDYPPGPLSRGTEGWVRVRFSVTAVGTVRDAVVVASEPGTLFDEAALKAVARWRYNPRVVNGEAVERIGLETIIRFDIEN